VATVEDFGNLRDRLSRALARRCPRWLRNQRDDIVQMAIMRLVQVAGRDERTTPYPSSYLWKVAYSAMIDEIRRLKRQRLVPIEPESLEIAGDDSRANPERAHAARETAAAIRDCIGALNPPRRRAVTLYLLGHPVPDIGRLMGWKLKKAENLVYRGLEATRNCLDAKGFHPGLP
jgi:RNA polymerase sigma-70 factor (ECF subfamily)